MFRARTDYPRELSDGCLRNDVRRSAQVQCGIARSILGAARSAGVPTEARCDESLLVVERWCIGAATAAEVRTAAREVTLRALEVRDEPGAQGQWRRRSCDAVLRACDAARDGIDGNPLERSSYTSLG